MISFARFIPKRLPSRIVIMFWVVSVLMMTSTYWYWLEVVVAQIATQEQAKVDLLVPLYASNAAVIMDVADAKKRYIQLQQLTSFILLKQDPLTRQMVFVGVELFTDINDKKLIDHPPPLDFTGFTADALVISDAMQMPVGILRLHYSDAFFEQIRADGEIILMRLFRATTVVLILVWFLLNYLLQPLQTLAKALRDWQPGDTEQIIPPMKRGTSQDILWINDSIHAFLKLLEKERKRIEESQSRFHGLLNAYQDPLFLFNATGKLIWNNPSAAHFIQLDANIIADQDCNTLFTDSLAPLASMTSKCLLTATPASTRLTTNHNVFDLRVFPAIMSDGIAVNAIVTAMNVNADMKLQEQALRTSNLATLGVLSASIAHEINNPNNVIMLNAPILQQSWKIFAPILQTHFASDNKHNLGCFSMDEIILEFPKLITAISNSSQRITRIVQQLKHLVRNDKGNMNDEVNMERTVNDAIALLNNKIQNSTNLFKTVFDANIPIIQGNTQQLEQVVINLIMNALDALQNPSQGVEVRLTVTPTGDYLLLSVHDEGVGIPNAIIARITEPLFTTREAKGGTGLGLSTCKRIIDHHHGTLKFASKEGQGTTVSAAFPLNKPSANPRQL